MDVTRSSKSKEHASTHWLPWWSLCGVCKSWGVLPDTWREQNDFLFFLITCHFKKLKIVGMIYKPEVILQAAGDGLVIPGVWVKVHICRSFGRWKGQINLC